MTNLDLFFFFVANPKMPVQSLLWRKAGYISGLINLIKIDLNEEVDTVYDP